MVTTKDDIVHTILYICGGYCSYLLPSTQSGQSPCVAPGVAMLDQPDLGSMVRIPMEPNTGQITGLCGYSPGECGAGNCSSNCDAKAPCGQYGAADA